MALIDDVRSKTGRAGIACWAERLQTRDPDLYGEVLDCFVEGLQYSAISATLKGHGLRVSATSLSRHDRGQCACL